MSRPISELSDAELQAVAIGFPSLDQLDDGQLAGVAVQQGLMQPEEAQNAIIEKKHQARKPIGDVLSLINPVMGALVAKGGKVGDVAAGVILPIGGAIAGSPGGPAGVAGGGAAGGLAGEGLVELRQYLRGERDEPSKGRLIANTAASAVPLGGPILKGPARTIITRGLQGAGIATTAEAAGQLIDEGKVDFSQLAATGALGLLFGGGLGAVESHQVRQALLGQIRRTPEFAKFAGTDAELVAAVRQKMAPPEAVAPEPRNVTPETPAGEQPALPTPGDSVPAGEEILRRAQAAGIEPTVPAPPLSSLSNEQLLAVAAKTIPLQGPDSGAGSAPNLESGGETSPVPASPAPQAPEQAGEPAAPAPGVEVPSSGLAVATAETPPAAGDQAMEIIAPQAAPVKAGRARSVGMAPDGAPDLLSDIEQAGGIRPPGESASGEYDGYAETFGQGLPRILRRTSGQAVDQLVHELNTGGRYNFQSVDEFYAAVQKAVATRGKLAGELQGLQHEQRLGQALFENKGRAAALRAKKAVPADSLTPGDTFTVRGEPVKVIGIDPDTGAVIVKNGAELRIPAGTDVFPDKGRVKRVKKQPVDEMNPFEDPAPYVAAHTRYRQLRALEQQGKLDPAGHAELDQVEQTLGQDFFAHYEATTGQGGPSAKESAALRQAQLKAGQERRLQGGELTSQVDMFGPTTDKEGQFALFESAVNDYLDARQVHQPLARAAIRGILHEVTNRHLARQLDLELGHDAAAADAARAIDAGQLYPLPAGPAGELLRPVGRSASALPAGEVLGRLGTPEGRQDLAQLLSRQGSVSSILPENIPPERTPTLAWKGMFIRRPEDLARLAATLRNPKQERVGVAVLDVDGRIITAEIITVGSTTSSIANPVLFQDVIGRAGEEAKYFYLWHNHPSGDPSPSAADIQLNRVTQAMRFPRDVTMWDHIITNGDTFYSWAKQKVLPYAEPPPPAAWEAARRTDLYRLKDEMDLNKVVQTVRATNQQGTLITLLNRKNAIIAVELLDPAINSSIGVWDRIFDSAARNGATAFTLDHPSLSVQTLREIRELAKEANEQLQFLDATGGFISTGSTARSMGLLEAAPRVTAKGVAEDPAEYIDDDQPLHAVDPSSGDTVPLQLAHLDNIPVVEMPELVQIVKELSGQIPKIKNLTSRGGYMRGEGKGLVVLNRKLFNDPVYMAQILAHELGHLIDYLPSQNLRRGNLLGRLASLRKHLTNQFAGAAATNKELRAELLALDQWWSPWDEASAKDWYKAYRHSAVELYAQALSVLFNAPHELKARAPKFWDEFFRFIDRKPEVKAELFATWDIIHQGANSVSAARSGNLKAGYARAEEILLDKAAERAGRRNSLEASIENWKQKHFDLYAPIIDRARQAKARGAVLPWHHDPEYVFDAHPLAENANYRFLDRVQKNVLNPLAAVTLDDTHLGDYLFFNRILHEAYQVADSTTGRTVLANPHGHNPATARRELLVMRYRLGPARMEALKAAARQFQDLVFEVVERGHASGIYSTDNFNRAKANRYNYATFAVVDYLEQSPYIPAAIKQQRGTLKDVANPFTATVLKMLTANKLAEHNQAKRVAVQLLTQHFPGEIAQAAVSKIPLASGRMMYRAKPAPHGKHELIVLRDGKPITWHVDRPIADMFEMRTPASSHAAIGVMNWAFRNLFYPVFLTYSPAFQLWMNPIRDLRRSYVNLPAGVKRRHYIGEQIRKNVTARARLLNDVQQADLVRRRTLRALAQRQPLSEAQTEELRTLDLRALSIELLATRALSTPFEAFAHNPTRDDVWGKMLQDYKLLPEEGKGTFLREHILGRLGLGAAADKLDKAGMILEAMPKAGAYHVLTRELGWTAGEAAQFVRNHVGTPNHMRRGKWASIDGTVIPFLNIFMQGFAGDLRQARGLALGPVDPRKQRFEWWRRMTEGTLLPRLLQALAAAGVLGAGLKKTYDAISDYNKTNYLVLPLGTTTGGDNGYKTVAMRLPEDETARVLGGLLHHTVQAAFNEDPAAKGSLTDLVNVMGGNVPGVNPIITLADGWRHYAAGVNPRDGLRGNTVMSSTQFNAGGWPRLQGMFGFTWDTVGGSNFIRWDRNANTTAEMVLGATPLLNRSLIITDAGLRERQEQANVNFDQRNAQIRANMPDNVNRLLAEYNRLQALRPETRTPEQQFRLKELSLWNAKIWQPNYRLMQELEAKDWRVQGHAVGDMSQAFERK